MRWRWGGGDGGLLQTILAEVVDLVFSVCATGGGGGIVVC